MTQVIDYNAHVGVFGSAARFDHLKGARDELVRKVDEGQNGGSKSDSCDWIHHPVFA